MKRKALNRGWLVLMSVGLFVVLLATLAYGTHGLYWSIYTPIYGRLLDSVPTPPGFLPESGWTVLLPEYPCGEIGYEVDKNQADLVNFYLTELPRVGWDLTEHDNRRSRITVADVSFEYSNYDNLVFVNQQQYWLSIVTSSYTDADGIQVRNSDVNLMVCSDKEWKNLGH